ncbi:MAG: DUF4011 domain-containing protein [Candidatus Borkfalkiaceae bacterium]|nr:DUF4011 domain-containing protein [Clostridia bacterium]MDY6223777.1 DUF4011 domain-containing protein [Christensenellaceae bacterium]
MATAKKANAVKEAVEITAGLPDYVGYADYFLQTETAFRLHNSSAENLTLTLIVADDKNLIVPYETAVEVPFESAAEVSASGLFSPLTLAENNEIFVSEVQFRALLDKTEVASGSKKITVLPYDFWEGLNGNAERLAAFVRPRLSDCARVLENAGKRLKKWDDSAEFYGYAAADKNAVRKIAAAIFAAVKQYEIKEDTALDLASPCLAAGEVSLLKSKNATALQAAVFCAAALERAGLHPVLAIGKSEVTAGVWLCDTCFPDTVTDDTETVEKYASDGINNLAFFDVKDLFEGENAAFTSSQSHFMQKLKAGYYEYFVDVKRCRLGGISSLPLRGKSVKGYELLKDEDVSDDAAPAPLAERESLKIEGQLPRNSQWERRLLDLTNRNALLNFNGRNALHICCADFNAFYAAFAEKKVLRLKGGAAEAEKFGAETTDSQKELYALENRRGIARVQAEDKLAAECAGRLFRRNREAGEETGVKILYLAMGFLKYTGKEDSMPRYAPLVLCPAEIRRAKGNEDYSLAYCEEEYFVNTTLLEYLKQAFNIDVRALGGDVTKHKISELVNIFVAETAGMKGWSVTKDVYVAAFSFQRYLMWHDVRTQINEFKKNALVSALITRRFQRSPAPAVKEEDEADPADTLTPLPADSSQFSAIALSRTGESFVLHGPPGTGKSQTITNIIANALEDNCRVLFVAEKRAALDVVKKRLTEIGLGDFCLELHSNKTDKTDVLHRIETTLALKHAEETPELAARAEEITALREELKAPMRALHKKRRLGVSVYQAILLYLKNKDAPDVLNIENSFYDSLTEAKLEECKSKILSAAAAAKECGGVCNSPFENVNVCEYSQELRDRIYCAGEVVITEIRHFRSYLALFLDLYRQKISAVTRQKTEDLCAIARDVLSGKYDKYFKNVTEERFFVFFNASRRLDELLGYYFRHFKTRVEVGKDYEKLTAYLNVGGDYKTDKCAAALGKKLTRAALHPLEADDINKFLQVLAEIHEAEQTVKSVSLSADFTDRSGNIIPKKREEYMRDLNELNARCARVFMEYNPDAFFGTCIRAGGGYTAPVLQGFLNAADSFAAARKSFCEAICADENRIASEDLPDYFYSRASALIDNLDMLANWCMYKKTVADLKKLGCHFIGEALESGKLTGANVLSGFEKNVYQNFLAINIPADPDLARCSVGTLEETVEKFRLAWDTFASLTKEKIRADLIARLPQDNGGDYGSLSVEIAAFTRLARTSLRGAGLRGLFAEVPELMKRVCPCLLMSPATVAQYLSPEANSFDLVIFDEASQMTTAEAVGAIARAKSAVIVGDPKQLPPTEFFNSAYVDEDNLENEDLESVLDDCLALGMNEKHLVWHYRSKHESLIAFSNNMYYDNRLCTFPSPDAMESKVKFVHVDGVYDRGFTKSNKKEAEALVEEVIRRLQDPVLCRSSMGVVTFSSAQQNYIERLLTKSITARRLEQAAYERDEPLFVKNLENVQGDERDVILFSVCYGPDAAGRVSLNFGPLNQSGGWRRLNVAVSRAREEMIVFSAMTSGMIDLSKTSSKGVAGLKSFLEFAERGKTSLAVKSGAATGARYGGGIGRYIAAELSSYGYECRYDVGASDFKIDVAVVNPKNRHEFILAILCDATNEFSVKDRNVLQVQSLKRANWNVLRVNCVNYYNNPKREIKRIKEALDRLSGAEKKGKGYMRYAKAYKAVAAIGGESAAFVTGGEHDTEITARLKEIVAVEEPISRAFLKTRCLQTFGILKSGARIEARLDALIDSCAFKKERAAGTDYYYKNDRAITQGKFRVENEPCLRKNEEDFTVIETLALIRAALEEKVSLYFDELTSLAAGVYRIRRPTERFAAFLRECVAYGESRGVLVRSVSDRIALA